MKPIALVVDNRLRLPLEGLTPELDEDLRAAFTHENPQRESMRRMNIPGWWGQPKVDVTWKLQRTRSGQWLTLPRGGMERVLKLLAKYGYEPHIDDRRCNGSEDLAGGLPRHKMQLRDYQEAAVVAAINAQTGMVRAGTGSGKTELLFGLASRLNRPTLILVNSRALLDQWVARAEKALGMRAKDVGVVQGSRRDLKPLTVAMQQSLHKQGFDEEFAQTWGLLGFDEVQLASASSFYAVVDRFPARYRIGVSADNRRKDGKEYLNHDLFGSVVYEIGREQLIDEKHILDVEISIQPTEFKADWYGVSQTRDDEKEIDFNRLSNEMAGDEERNTFGIDAAVEMVSEGRQVFVMARRREHCQRIAAALVARGVRAGFMIGGEDFRKEFEATAKAMREGRVSVGVGTVQSIGTGIDFPSVSGAVVMTPLAGNKQLFNQVRGRLCRNEEGKRAPKLVYLWDKRCSYALSHLKNMVSQNRTVTVLAPGGVQDGADYLKALKRAAAW